MKCAWLAVSLIIACEPAPGGAPRDAGPDARPPPTAIRYTGEIKVGTAGVVLRLGSVGDGCEDCTFYYERADGCLGSTDSSGCSAACNPCIERVTIASGGVEREYPAHSGNFAAGYPHEAMVGEVVTVRIDGCLGPHWADVTVRAWSPLTVESVQPLEGDLIRVSWVPAGRADVVDVSAFETFGGSSCRRFDTGQEVVAWQPERSEYVGVSAYEVVRWPRPFGGDRITVLANVGSGGFELRTGTALTLTRTPQTSFTRREQRAAGPAARRSRPARAP